MRPELNLNVSTVMDKTLFLVDRNYLGQGRLDIFVQDTFAGDQGKNPPISELDVLYLYSQDIAWFGFFDI
jgi:hypothetical protein